MPAPYSGGMAVTPPPRTIGSKLYNTRRVLVVDADLFAAEMARHKATSDEQIAQLLQTDRKTVGRIRRGESLPSNGFFAACSDAGVDFLSFLSVKRSDALAERAA